MIEMFDFNNIFRGYSSEQYSEAIVETLIQFLINKDLITSDEVKEYYSSNCSEILQSIVKRDDEELDKRFRELRRENGDE